MQTKKTDPTMVESVICNLETNLTQIYYKYLFFSIFLLFVIIRLADVALRYVERSEEILFI